MSDAGHIPVSLVVAIGHNSVIGHENKLPWRVSSDLKRFRALTLGKPVIMGRRTYDAIGRVLDGRDVILLSKTRGFVVEGATVATSMEQALEIARHAAETRGADEICVVGGGQVYAQAMPLANILRVSHVDASLEDFDAIFPPIDPVVWEEVAREDLPRTEGDTATAIHITYRHRAR